MGAMFDPDKDADNTVKHGLSLVEGEGVLNDPLGLTVEDESSAGESRWITVGMNTSGEILVVVWTERNDGERLISARRATARSGNIMKAEYDFSKGRRGQAGPTKGKARITIYLDNQIVAAFKAESARTGIGYQTLINEALGQHLGTSEKPITAEQVRKIVRDELAHTR